MSTLRASDPVVAIATSDIHLSLKPPVARAEEDSWFDAMARALFEIHVLANKHDVPVFCAGDIFDKWNAPAELINFALQHLPDMYAIPGNHDLPTHQVELIKRSAYWTLVEAGKVTNLSRPTFLAQEQLMLVPFPFGGVAYPPGPDDRAGIPVDLEIAITHEYLWVPGSAYTGAAQDQRLGSRAKTFAGFDVVIVGDNHQGFLRKLKNGTRVLNCGTLLRRKSNEASYRPHVGLVHRSGKVSLHHLDISKDKLSETATVEEAEQDEGITEFVEELASLQPTSLNFRDAIRQALDKSKAKKLIRQIVEEALSDRD